MVHCAFLLLPTCYTRLPGRLHLQTTVCCTCNPTLPRTPTLLVYDQGFFIYNYLVLHEARTFAAAGPYTPWSDRWPLSQRWVAHHFFYAHKPWAPWARCVPSVKSECPEYLYIVSTLCSPGALSTLTFWRSAATTAAAGPHAAIRSLPRRSAAWAGPGRGYAAHGSNPGLADPTARQAYYSRLQALAWTGAYRGDVRRVRRALDAQGRGVEGAAQVGVPPAALVPGLVGHRVGDLLRSSD